MAARMPCAASGAATLPSVRAHHTAHAVEQFLAVVRSRHGGATPAESVDAEQA